jgi:hypothetical protein
MVRLIIPLACALLLLLTGCAGDAVVFAPTPAPPDLSPLPYTHPSGVFSVVVPRTWSVYEINTTVLAAASFSRPNEDESALTIAVIDLGEAVGDDAFRAQLDRYQTQIRPDIEQYREQARTAMGDGSFRLTGIRTLTGGDTEQVNTFVQGVGSRLLVLDMALPGDGGAQSQLQQIINSVTLNADAPLTTSSIETLADAKPAALGLLHVFAWTTPQGVLFITGEVANYSTQTFYGLPVRALLETADGAATAEAVDSIMGYALPPGSFAPFSLRFGQGQPSGSAGFRVLLGGETAQAEARPLYPTEQLMSRDQSFVDSLGRLIIQGEVENIGQETALAPRVIVTVFDAAQNVIAAGFTDVSGGALVAGASAAYEVAIPEFGGEPVTTSVSVQAFAE